MIFLINSFWLDLTVIDVSGVPSVTGPIACEVPSTTHNIQNSPLPNGGSNTTINGLQWIVTPVSGAHSETGALGLHESLPPNGVSSPIPTNSSHPASNSVMPSNVQESA